MSRDLQRLPDYLAHILEAIERIDSYTRHLDAKAFTNEKLVQDAVIRNLEVIGEAGNNIEKHHPGFAAAHPELPLSIAYDMRNALAHGYFKVDLAVVWQTIQSDLPELKVRITRAREDLLDGQDPAILGP
ncbi:MAG: DUF86 domain-containing protein [Curvibacter lanceolatus]|uniref:HepT-like ribonuclease domain-containing protein n=1 Tax=Curvibacter lanceolatus TaxID=86182 RepID=UPI0003A5EAE1|nr:DUF86 domain-containing protein [Curvibacter lanceolatus]MBV5295273.1 DUF86 domain-containing protein [Curvibacter lanceolatus]